MIAECGCLFCNRSQKTSKCGKNISDTLSCASCATFLFLPHFDVICDSISEQTHGNIESILLNICIYIYIYVAWLIDGVGS